MEKWCVEVLLGFGASFFGRWFARGVIQFPFSFEVQRWIVLSYFFLKRVRLSVEISYVAFFSVGGIIGIGRVDIGCMRMGASNSGGG